MVCHASGLPAFVRTVIHDGDARMDRIDDGAGVRLIEAVMRDEVEIDGADGIVGADERDFFGLGEIAEIEKIERAEADKDADGAGIFGRIEIPLGFSGAVGIGHRLDAGDADDVFAVGGEHDDFEAGNVDGVAGMHDAARLAFNGLQIVRGVCAGNVGVFAVDAVVDELADLDALDQLGTPPT